MDGDTIPAQCTDDSEQWNTLIRWIPDNPGLIALLWAFCVAVHVVDTVLFPSGSYNSVSSIVYIAGGSVFAALVVSSILHLRAQTLKMIVCLTAINLLFSIGWLLLELNDGAVTSQDYSREIGYICLQLLMVFCFIWHFFRLTHSRIRRILAITSFVVIYWVTISFIGLDSMFWRLSAQASPWFETGPAKKNGLDESDIPDIEIDRLWEAQSGLMKRSLQSLRQRNPNQRNIFAIAIAPQGTQKLFSREAHAALHTFSAGFGSSYRGGVLLSNGGADYLQAPLATRSHIADVTRGIGSEIDPEKDLVVIYLTAHGGRNAELASELADYRSVLPISSTSLAEALKRSGIGKRVIVISSCYAGSWISALANDDTIVITAAAADRTSFGCTDDREMTLFGEAFLQGPLAKGASLQKTFESAKKKITDQEKGRYLRSSNPQAFVGRNMKEFWLKER